MKQNKTSTNALVICSGGLDSVCLAYVLSKQGELGHLLSFDYGQRHKKELNFARQAAQNLNIPHTVLDISNIGATLTGASLTDKSIDVPDGHYAEETMRITVVPNRNAIMLTIAFGLASAKGLNAVGTAVHGGDHFIYPDCRPGFVKAFAEMQRHALEGVSDVAFLTPFLNETKADIVRHGTAAGVPFHDTWSCYKGGEIHCGRCGTCVERREAFYLAGIKDPTTYADQDFWQEAVKQHQQKQAQQ